MADMRAAMRIAEMQKQQQQQRAVLIVAKRW
jgi:hypothetical protein